MISPHLLSLSLSLLLFPHQLNQSVWLLSSYNKNRIEEFVCEENNNDNVTIHELKEMYDVL